MHRERGMDEVAEAKRYEWEGELLTVNQLIRFATNGISAQALRYRLSHGVDLYTAMTEPIKQRTKKPGLPCGAKSQYDCLNCKYDDMPCLKYFTPMKGETNPDYIFEDYGKR